MYNDLLVLPVQVSAAAADNDSGCSVRTHWRQRQRHNDDSLLLLFPVVVQKVQNLGLRIRAGYEANDESVQVYHCICHRAWHHILDSCTLIVIYDHRINRIELTATAALSMSGQGFEPRTKRILNAGNGL